MLGTQAMGKLLENVECCNDVEQDDEDRRRIAQQILLKSTDFLRRIMAPASGQGGITLSYVCPHCLRHSLEDNSWWVSHLGTERNGATGGFLYVVAKETEMNMDRQRDSLPETLPF